MLFKKLWNYFNYLKRKSFRAMMNCLSTIKIIQLSKEIKATNKNKIYLIGTPQHGNLGDHAIAFAEIKFLIDNYKNYLIIEIPYSNVKQFIIKLKLLIKPNDIIMLQGGGNLGIEYFWEETIRRTIISTFYKQRIIILPQTIDFGDSERGKIEFENSKTIYGSHTNLTIVAREKHSYKVMKNAFKTNNILLTPDIVLYLDKSAPKHERNQILICLRSDKESILKEKFKSQLKNVLKSLNKGIIETDTVVNYHILKGKRQDELDKIWSMFRRSNLVITDRLHGMVFAAITGTPCVVFSNYNHKVKGTYEWIKHLPYIKFVENPDSISEQIDELLSLDPKELKYDNSFAMDYYNEISSIIDARQFGGDDRLITEKLV